MLSEEGRKTSPSSAGRRLPFMGGGYSEEAAAAVERLNCVAVVVGGGRGGPRSNTAQLLQFMQEVDWELKGVARDGQKTLPHPYDDRHH